MKKKSDISTQKVPTSHNGSTLNSQKMNSSQLSNRSSSTQKSKTVAFQQELEDRRASRQAKLQEVKDRRSVEKQAALLKAEEERNRILMEEKKLQKTAQEAKLKERLKKESLKLKKEEEDKLESEKEQKAVLFRNLALTTTGMRGLRLNSLVISMGMSRAADWHRRRNLCKYLYPLILELEENWKEKRRACIERDEKADLDYVRVLKRYFFLN